MTCKVMLSSCSKHITLHKLWLLDFYKVVVCKIVTRKADEVNITYNL